MICQEDAAISAQRPSGVGEMVFQIAARYGSVAVGVLAGRDHHELSGLELLGE